MQKLYTSLLLLLFIISCKETPLPEKIIIPEEDRSYLSYDVDMPGLFEAVQLGNVFPDSKTFVDCIPKQATSVIMEEYAKRKDGVGFDIKNFVLEFFDLPKAVGNAFVVDTTKTTAEHIDTLWTFLMRKPDVQVGTLLPLPYTYIVPGGRFGEIYYWDSYFTMLGLEVSEKDSTIQLMVDNFAFLIDEYGHIPNGNRSYYLGRSQPPFFAAMVNLLANAKEDPKILVKYLPQLEKEHTYWMAQYQLIDEAPGDGVKAVGRTVRLDTLVVLNRYYDDLSTPRPEAYKEDLATAKASGRNPEEVYKNLRAGAESGWDFSSRWFKDGKSLTTIHTLDILPVDLNALLYHLEKTLEKAAIESGHRTKMLTYGGYAAKRKEIFDQYFWNEEQGFYFDYDFKEGKQKETMTLAGVYPLFFGLANDDQAKAVAANLEKYFLKPGGLTTTRVNSGQQWDAPNGWAPLQWMAIEGLRKYGQTAVAKRIAMSWIKNNERVYNNTHKMVEKYNVFDLSLEAGGGEYPVQDGFGWSNGVYLRLYNEYIVHKN